MRGIGCYRHRHKLVLRTLSFELRPVMHRSGSPAAAFLRWLAEGSELWRTISAARFISMHINLGGPRFPHANLPGHGLGLRNERLTKDACHQKHSITPGEIQGMSRRSLHYGEVRRDSVGWLRHELLHDLAGCMAGKTPMPDGSGREHIVKEANLSSYLDVMWCILLERIEEAATGGGTGCSVRL